MPIPKNSYFLFATLTLAAIMLGLIVLGERGESLFEFDREKIAQGDWYRLLSGHLIHYGNYHLMMNIAGLGLTLGVLWSHLNTRHFLWVSFSSALFISLGILFFSPTLFYYGGFSGIIHTLIAFALITDFKQAPATNSIVLTLLLIKVGYEQTALYDPHHALLPVLVAVDAHLYGVIAGIILSIIYILAHRFQSPICMINTSSKP